MSQKIFFPRMNGLNEVQIKTRLLKLQKKYTFLTNGDINHISYYSDPLSPYTGTIIDKTSQFICYPFDRSFEEFLIQYPGGIFWAPQEKQLQLKLTFRPISGNRYRCNQTSEITTNPKQYRYNYLRARQTPVHTKIVKKPEQKIGWSPRHSD